MTKILKLSGLALVLCAISVGVFAQEKTAPKEKKESNDIIIHKKGESKEKLTVVIDGDKVTVNGKPVEDYKSDDVDIIRSDNDMEMPYALAVPPMPPHGGEWNVMGDDFMHEIHSNKAFLGVMTKEGNGGAEITDVTKESPAEKAGLKEGDIITKVNDDKVEDADDLYKAIGKYKPGTKVNVTYKRSGKETTIPVELSENKQVRVYSWKNGDNDNYSFNFKTPAPYVGGWNTWGDRPRLGVQVQDTEDGKGVKVLEVEDDEAADKAGLKEDDIITQVNGKNVTSVDDLKETMKAAKKGDTLKITYTRDGKTQTADIKFPKDLKTTDL